MFPYRKISLCKCDSYVIEMVTLPLIISVVSIKSQEDLLEGRNEQQMVTCWKQEVETLQGQGIGSTNAGSL